MCPALSAASRGLGAHAVQPCPTLALPAATQAAHLQRKRLDALTGRQGSNAPFLAVAAAVRLGCAVATSRRLLLLTCRRQLCRDQHIGARGELERDLGLGVRPQHGQRLCRQVVDVRLELGRLGGYGGLVRAAGNVGHVNSRLRRSRGASSRRRCRCSCCVAQQACCCHHHDRCAAQKPSAPAQALSPRAGHGAPANAGGDRHRGVADGVR
jgi:hypothetical protein